jgi:LysM repeat protein
MATYTVKKGDTVWSLASRALQAQTGKKPTNAEIQRMVGRVSTPSGNRNQIKPGEKITIPVSSRPPAGSGSRSRSAGDERAQQPAPRRRAGSDDASTGSRAKKTTAGPRRSGGVAKKATKTATSGRNAGPRRSGPRAVKKATAGAGAAGAADRYGSGGTAKKATKKATARRNVR